MPSLEGLKLAGEVVNQSADQINDVSNQLRLQGIASQASDLAKQGDFQGAYGLLFKARPDLAAQILPQMEKSNPQLAQSLIKSHTVGQLEGQTEFGSNPRQLLDASMAGKLAIAQNKASPSDTVVRNDPNSPTGYSLINKKSGQKQNATQAGLPDKQVDESTKVPQLRPNEDINSEGKKVMLSPEQQKVIKETRKTFDSETKDIVKGIDASNQALELINKNIPGSGTIEKLRLLRGVVQGRINQQEFTAFGKGQGILNSIDNAISEAKGNGMSSKVQDLMRQMATVAVNLQEKEYEQHLKNAVERNPEVDPLILKKRLMGSGPTIHQALVKQIDKLPPEDQAAVNWAHDNPNDPRAKAILQKIGQ